MKRIRKDALGPVLISAGTILAFLLMARPARTAPLFADVIDSSITLPTGENAYYVMADIWPGASSDGPAHLPHGCVYTSLDGSPSSDKVISLAAGGDVVGTVKAASCGDTIHQNEGASFTLNGIRSLRRRIATQSSRSRFALANPIPRYPGYMCFFTFR